MYNYFNEDIPMYDYLRSFFRDCIHIDKDGALWVSEDVYHYVYATINAHAVYDETGEFTIDNIEDSKEWQTRWINEGLIKEL
jgi:hypothetical protein